MYLKIFDTDLSLNCVYKFLFCVVTVATLASDLLEKKHSLKIQVHVIL